MSILPTTSTAAKVGRATDLIEAAIDSPLWPTLALMFTYDEGGGLFDHVSPPAACPPSVADSDFDVLGHRVPLFVVSPYARPGYVSHETASHTSILRFIQLVHELPALTARDATSNALLDLFGFGCVPPLINPPDLPGPGGSTCVAME